MVGHGKRPRRPSRQSARLRACARRPRSTPPWRWDPVRLRASFLCFVWIWNHHQGYGTPDLHLRIARWLEREGVKDGRRLALLVFRDAGKSTLVGLYCAWLLANDPDLRILVLAAEHALACRMTRNVRRIVEAHPLARHLRPRRKEEWAADRFTVHRRRGGRDPSLFARGIGANLTGSRADVIVCDDVEVPNTAASAKRRADLRLRLAEASFILVPNGLQLYVGTPHAWHSIYAAEPRLELGEARPFLDGCRRLVLPLIDAKGNSAWPERFPPAAVERLRAEVGPRLFQSQMLLEPTPIEAARLDPERLTFYDAPLGRRARERAPATAHRRPSDAQRLLLVGPRLRRPGQGRRQRDRLPLPRRGGRLLAARPRNPHLRPADHRRAGRADPALSSGGPVRGAQRTAGPSPSRLTASAASSRRRCGG